MLANRVRMGTSISKYVLAKDADFTGTTNGSFKYVGTKEYITIPHVIKGVPITSYASMFSNNSVIKGVRSNNTNVTDMSAMFESSTTTELDLSGLDTSNVTDMSAMFDSCSSLTSLDLSRFDTSNVTDMSYMFYECRGLTSLDLSSFDTSNVTSMFSLFNGCSSLTTFDLSSFDTSNVTSTDFMFYETTATTGYARTQADADTFNYSDLKPDGLTFIVKP